MKEPDFLVVGTARAGTSALHYYLRQHPQIFIPSQKEPCYYCFAGEKPEYKRGKFLFTITKHAHYLHLFNDAAENSVKGEISTPYLYLYDKTIRNIFKLHSNPQELKIIIILRNPVERAYSHYLLKVQDGREELSFEEALAQEKKRIVNNFSFDYFYAQRGLYYQQVKAYLDKFPDTKIFMYEEFKNQPQQTLSEICTFLGVDASFNFEKRESVNASSTPRFNAIGKLITLESKVKYKMLRLLPDNVRLSIKQQFIRLNRSTTKVPPMSDWAKTYLNHFYKDDLRKLQSLTRLNLTEWIKA